MTPARRAALLVAWLGALVLAGGYVAVDLKVGGDLRLFMPAPQTPAERLLLQQVGDGPGSRVWLLAIEGDEAPALASTSQRLAGSLRADPAFQFVANGEAGLESVPAHLLPYRYLLSPTLDHAHLDAPTLRAALEARVRDLASGAGLLLEDWLPRDPTLETLALVQSWLPARQAHRAYEVWFDADETRALLVLQTAAAGFDPRRQREAQDRIEAAFEASREGRAQRLVTSGPGAFSVLMQERTAGEATTLGAIASVGMLALLVLAYRRWRPVLLGALPIASAGVFGLAAVSLLFDAVHGITLAFGFTLIGVAQDYPIHLFSHQHRGITPLANARALWPTLATGVASTCIAYLAFAASGVTGLQQLACFTIAGLAAAGLSTRYLLPPLMHHAGPDPADSDRLGAWWRRLAALPRPRALVPALALACLAVIALRGGALWQNNLAELTPVPPDLLQRDGVLRQALGAPDVRYLIAIEGADADAVLAREEQLAAALDALVSSGTIAGYESAARLLPSAGTQERRRQSLPSDEALRAALSQASDGLPFQTDLFEPFLADVSRARGLPVLTPTALADTALGTRVSGLLLVLDGRHLGLVAPSGVRDPAALAAFASAHRATLLDLKDASEQLVVRLRERIVASLAVAALLLVAVVAWALGDRRRARRVLLPMALTTLIVVAVLHGAGVPLSLFHLIALVLAAGLGLDYALFFEQVEHDPGEQRRTLHAVLVCAASTLMVFALLACSSLPVLRAIGVTVSIGVVSNFLLALMLTRPDVEHHRA